MAYLKENKEFSQRQDSLEKKQNEEGLWKMFFDGSLSKEGVVDEVCIIYPNREFKVFSVKLNFECTNNVAKYEALLLVLNYLKGLGAKRIDVFGYSELVINQVNDNYHTKHQGCENT